MIIVRLIGGLGNQMFEYAAARRLAHKHNTILKLDTSPLVINDYHPKRSHQFNLLTYGLHNFNIQENIANSMDVFKMYPIEGLRRMTRDGMHRKLSYGGVKAAPC